VLQDRLSTKDNLERGGGTLESNMPVMCGVEEDISNQYFLQMQSSLVGIE